VLYNLVKHCISQEKNNNISLMFQPREEMEIFRWVKKAARDYVYMYIVSHTRLYCSIISLEIYKQYYRFAYSCSNNCTLLNYV